MSFSGEIKAELCELSIGNEDTARAELYGFLLFCKSFKNDNIVFSTENADSAGRFCLLLAGCCKIIAQVKYTSTNKKSGAMLYTSSVVYKNDVSKVFDYVMHNPDDISLRINKALIDSAEAKCAFLRGVFLCTGTVSNPEREYHLEFSSPYKNVVNDLCNLISSVSEEISDIKIIPRTLIRKGNYIVYFKDKDAIAEILAIIGASKANMVFIQKTIEKDIINRTTRITNSEIANSNKTAKAAAVQLEAIKKLKTSGKFNSLSDELKELAILRYENPEMSLRELGESLNPKISRSGVNHRLNQIVEMSKYE